MGQRAVSELFGQLVRFGMVGGFTTGLYALVYSPLAKYEVTSPQVANICGYLVAMATGYFLHSRWSFRGHGTRDNPVRTTSRFFLVSLVSYALNAFWVFVLTDSRMFDGEWWWPLLPIVLVTPLVIFALNRRWVFG
ncbi:MAG: GtrA family protein [Sphingosinicella sp.]|uniref:GtrA family protein n=1 Tax=Sphingosinicella sp. TaxID=1917971 RepID=UPI004037787D